MAIKKVFEFDDYKTFLSHLEQERAHFSRGFRSRLAEEIGCNNAFISQVLNTHAHFSLEQSISLCNYFKLSDEEERYFLFLVELARAGTPALREWFRTLLDEIRDKYLNIKGRVKQQTALSAEAQATYYSHWYYAAIHMIVTVPNIRTIRDISGALKLSSSIVEKVVAFLLSYDLLIEKNGEFLAGPSYLHLDRDSPNISKHHSNWRMVAINSLQNEKKTDVHYSTVSTLSKKDAETLRSKLVQEIQNYVQTVSQSKEETMYCFNLDFFKMIEEF
jgi:uncharacterized protein (TIGR02147 family)